MVMLAPAVPGASSVSVDGRPIVLGKVSSVPVAIRVTEGPGAEHRPLRLSPAKGLTKVRWGGCSGAATTAPFAAGSWSGTVRVDAEAAGIALTASSGDAAGASAAFDVLGGGTAPGGGLAATADGGGQGAP